jgi:hypothetical protein
MATLVHNMLTLLEVAKRKDTKGNSIAIAEVLDKHIPMFRDAIWVEGNGASYHKYTRRAYIPEGTLRGVNQGVIADATKTTDHLAQIAVIENYSDIDKRLVEMSANPADTRMKEGKGIIQGLGQRFENELIYGSINKDPNGFEGLATMLNSLSLTNVISAGGDEAGTCSSVYAVQWGPDKVYVAYPKGSGTAGVTHIDKGLQTKTYYGASDATTSQYMLEVYRDLYGIAGGIVVEDPKAVGRICNIDAVYVASSEEKGITEDLMIDLLSEFRNPGEGGIVFYCNRSLWAQFNKLVFGSSVTAAKTFYPVTDPFGNVVASFMGYPIKLCEKIRNDEDQIS